MGVRLHIERERGERNGYRVCIHFKIQILGRAPSTRDFSYYFILWLMRSKFWIWFGLVWWAVPHFQVPTSPLLFILQ